MILDNFIINHPVRALLIFLFIFNFGCIILFKFLEYLVRKIKNYFRGRKRVSDYGDNYSGEEEEKWVGTKKKGTNTTRHHT
jgi:hypothetical protein